MDKLSDYVKTAEATELLGVSRTASNEYVEAGKFPVPKYPS